MGNCCPGIDLDDEMEESLLSVNYGLTSGSSKINTVPSGLFLTK